MTTTKLVVVLGGVALFIGLVLGFTPLTFDGEGCGSAFAPDHKLTTPVECNQAVHDRRVPAGMVAGVGLAVAAIAVLGESAARTNKDPEPPAE